MNIFRSTIPSHSLFRSNDYDYTDSIEANFYTEKVISSSELGKSFFLSAPPWVEVLFEMRNRLVKFFGLKTSESIKDRKEILEHFKCVCGEQLGLFRVYEKNDKEVIIGEDDIHLNFRVSLFIEQSPSNDSHLLNSNLTITTAVDFNNWLGKLYFLPVKPFHKIIVPAMLRRIVKQLTEN